jgi:branched-chain amino acid transport system substrate-binding protein
MCPKRSLSYKFIALALALVLIVPILAACGKEKEETPAPTPIATSTPVLTATPTAVATVTPTPTSSEPVKIGVIGPWSGPMAVSGNLADQIIAVVEQQLKDMGGILGGRQVKFVKGDDRGVLAEAVGQARRLALEENVDMLAFGGVSGASFNAVAQAAEELKVPYISPATIYGQATMKYNISIYTSGAIIDRIANFPIEFVKPKTIAWLAWDDDASRYQLDGVEGVVGARARWKEKGIDIIYEQYFPQDTADFSPYLTTIKFKNPDLAIISLNNLGQAITINKQIMELGGWGDFKVFYSTSAASGQKAVSMPAALGNYTAVEWLPGSDDPGMKAFEDAFKKTHGRLPSPDLAYYYNCFWTGIKAMELAGTSDRDKVAQAMRSGNLEWDSAWGHLRIPPDGKGIASLMVAQIQEGGKLVKVWPQ